MITRTHAHKLRAMIVKAAVSLTDTDALTAVELFPKWQDDAEYSVNDRVRYNDLLYKCLQAHTAQASWKPDVSPSLWVRVDDPSHEFPEWVQPTGATDAYNKGDKVSHNEKHWISDYDNNTWEPSVFGWSEV